MTTLKRLIIFLLLAAVIAGVLFAANAALGGGGAMPVHERPERAISARGFPAERGDFHHNEGDFELGGFVSTLAPLALIILTVVLGERLVRWLRRKRRAQPTAGT